VRLTVRPAVARALLTAFVVFTAMSTSAAGPVQREAELRCVVLDAGDGGVVGRVERARVRVATNRARAPSVGVLSSASSDGEDQWRPTLWQAAFVSTHATQTSLLDWEFTVQVQAPLRDRSVGLLTAAMLTVLLRNEKALPGSTIIGALNPDGSAGPVDELLPRLRAAAADGVKRLGIPFGARTAELAAEAQRLGVELKELAGLDDAHLFLTGEALPRPPPVTEADMDLWPQELKSLARITTRVRKELDEELPAVLDGGSGVGARLERASQQAAELERSGDAVRAFVVWTSALTLVRVVAQDQQLQRVLAAGDAPGVVGELQRQRDAFVAELAELRRQSETRFTHTSRANDMYAMDVLESIVSQGVATRAEADVTGLPADAGVPARARELAEALVRGREDLRNGRRFVELYASLPVLKTSAPPLDAARLANAWVASRGAMPEANLERDPTALELRGYEALLRTERDDRARLLLAARQGLYAAHLSNVYGALGGQLSERGVLSIRNPRALSAQLEHARARVLQSCGRAQREASMVPLAARLRYLNARAAREGSDGQKAEALADLWVANWWCELAVSAAR
jgi:hypothetical protein